MKWFGHASFSPACTTTPQVPIPVDKVCAWCEEGFTPADSGYLIPYMGTADEPTELAYHVECQLRQIVGSVGHISHRCSCYGGTEEDPPGLTKREAADAAVTAARLEMPRKPPPSIEWE